MRQRVALIRTLALKPDILILDEPFSKLDYQSRLKVSDDVYKIIKEEGKTALMVTHDFMQAAKICDRFIIIKGGRVADDFSVAEGDAAILYERYKQVVEGGKAGC